MRRGLPAAAAGLALLLLAPMLPATAAPVAVVMPDGRCLLRNAPADALAALEAALAEEAARLRHTTARQLGDAAAMRLAMAREGVPAFGDWAYDWVQSYITSYRVLALAAKGLAEGVVEGDPDSLVERITDGMAMPVREAFRSRVLAPAIPPEALVADLRHVSLLVDGAWAEALAAAARDAGQWPVSAVAAAPRIDFVAAAASVGAAMVAVAPADPLALIVEEGADAGTVFLRSMRPMAARLGAVVVRLSETGSILATTGAFGYALGGLPGVAVGAAGGIGLSWGIDWLFNRVDASLNRRAFEAQALEAISRAERRLASQGAAAVAVALAARRGALLPAAEGCP
jgi:hypothetical protein